MFDTLDTGLETPPSYTFADRTYRTRRALRRFLATLTPGQLAQTEVMVDDDTYVVFYPVLPVNRPRHFDTGENAGGSKAAGELAFSLEEVAVA